MSALNIPGGRSVKSFVKNSLDQNRCDVLMGVPSSLTSVDVTKPYYQSTYVFVSRQDRTLHPGSLSDPRLSDWRIGVQVVGNDYAPPAFALARRGITKNVVGFSLFGPYGEPNPPRSIIDAVAMVMSTWQSSGDHLLAILRNPLMASLTSFQYLPRSSSESLLPMTFRWACAKGMLT